MADKDKDHAQVRASTLAAFDKGGSVFVGGKFVSNQKDLPDDHPARYDDGEGPKAVDSGEGDVLLLSRIVELEAQCTSAYAYANAADASRNVAELALDAVKRERDRLAEQVAALTGQAADYSARNNSVDENAAQKDEADPVGTPDHLAAIPALLREQASQQAAQPAPTADGGQAASSTTSTPLPADFPKRDVLVAAGHDTVEAVAGKTVEQLAEVQGLSAGAAKAVKAAADAATTPTGTGG